MKRSLLNRAWSVSNVPVGAALNSGCSSATTPNCMRTVPSMQRGAGVSQAHLTVEPNEKLFAPPRHSPLRTGTFHYHTHYVTSVDNSTFIDSLDHLFSLWKYMYCTCFMTSFVHHYSKLRSTHHLNKEKSNLLLEKNCDIFGHIDVKQFFSF